MEGQNASIHVTPTRPVFDGLPTPPHSDEKLIPLAGELQQSFDGPPTPPRSPRPGPPSPFPWLTSSPLARPSSSFAGSRRASNSSGVSGDFARLSCSPAPSGYEHLDYGADYFATPTLIKREPRSFEWEWCAAASKEVPTGLPTPPPSAPLMGLFGPQDAVLKRRLGPNETSYYLSSRGNGPSDVMAGVNDMYLHIGFSAPAKLVTPERVLAIWTEMRLRHTLLSSRVEFQGYEEIRFVYDPPENLEIASQRAAETFGMSWDVEKDVALDNYLNGPRTLSDEHLAGLRITSPASGMPEDPEEMVQFDYWLFATHFLGDGMALHTFSNIFFRLLGGELEKLSEQGGLQWDADGSVPTPPITRLPPAMESRIATPASWGRLAWTAARVEFQRNQNQLIGGQTFPRRKLGERKTLVPTVAFTAAETSAILKKCKANGCTIAHAVFALSNIAHMRVIEQDARAALPQWSAKARDPSLPTMLYSALNLRPNMTVPKEVTESGETPDFFHLVIGYYNVILPTFKPAGLTEAQIFWHRARETKAQSLRATKSKWLTPRSKLMSLDRERRSIGFERAADLKRLPQPKMGASLGLGLDVGSAPPPSVPDTKKDAAPSLALLGVSMLGNLDGMYKHAEFPDIKLASLTTGSRQRPGSSLLFAYTFAGKLWLSLGYDANGYEPGTIQKWWTGVQSAVREFLLDEPTAIAA